MVENTQVRSFASSNYSKSRTMFLESYFGSTPSQPETRGYPDGISPWWTFLSKRLLSALICETLYIGYRQTSESNPALCKLERVYDCSEYVICSQHFLFRDVRIGLSSYTENPSTIFCPISFRVNAGILVIHWRSIHQSRKAATKEHEAAQAVVRARPSHLQGRLLSLCNHSGSRIQNMPGPSLSLIGERNV